MPDEEQQHIFATSGRAAGRLVRRGFAFFQTQEGLRTIHTGAFAVASEVARGIPFVRPVLNFIRTSTQPSRRVRTQTSLRPFTMTSFRRRSTRFRNAITAGKGGFASKRALASMRRRKGRINLRIISGQRKVRNNMTGLNHPKEVKTLDDPLQTRTVALINSNAELFPVTNMIEGTGDDQRIGRLIKAVRILWTIRMDLPVAQLTEPTSDAVRLMLVIDHSKVSPTTSGTDPKVEDVLEKNGDSPEEADTQSWYNKDTKPRFTILVDKVYPLANEDKNITIIDGGTVSLNGLICSYGGPTASDNDVGTDNIWVLIGSQTENAEGNSQFDPGNTSAVTLGILRFGTRFEYVG